MHEVSVISDLVRAILIELEKYNVVSVKKVTIILGKLTNLGIEQMEFAYEIVTRGTILEGSKLNIEEEDVEIECKQCNYRGPVKTLEYGEYADGHFIPVLACPECNGPINVIRGQTCCVKNIDIEEVE